MRGLPIFMLMALASGFAMAQSAIYKTTDENGNVIFTDKGSESAEEVPVQAPQTFEAKKLANEYKEFQPAEKAPPEDTSPPYEILAITSPANDEAIRSNPGNVEITFNMQPGLLPGHRLELHMDGGILRNLNSGKPVALENIDRGTHTAQLKVIDTKAKKEVQSSDPVSFTVLRVSTVPKKTPK